MRGICLIRVIGGKVFELTAKGAKRRERREDFPRMARMGADSNRWRRERGDAEEELRRMTGEQREEPRRHGGRDGEELLVMSCWLLGA